MLTKHRYWLLALILLLLLPVIAGCAGNRAPVDLPGDVQNGAGPGDSGTADPGTPGESSDEYFDFNALYLTNKRFKDGESFKMNLWQKVGGEESSGWITLAFTETDNEISFEYAWELGELEFSGTGTLPEGEGPQYSIEGAYLFNLFADYLARETSYAISNVWQYCYIPVLENFEGLDFEKIGDRSNVMGYEMEVAGYKTYAGQKGINFTMHKDGKLLYELCISPDLPVNLYTYIYDHNGDEYRVELVEYND